MKIILCSAKKTLEIFFFIPGEILSASEKYSTHDYILNEFTVKSRLIIKDFAASDMGSYSCVGRNMFNTKGDREEAKIIVKFIKSQFENSCQENQIIIHYILFPKIKMF